MGKRVVAAMFQFVSGLTSMQCTLFVLAWMSFSDRGMVYISMLYL